LIHGSPNGATHLKYLESLSRLSGRFRFLGIVNKVSCLEYIGTRSELRELKHLST
jgi:hypothetical protein